MRSASVNPCIMIHGFRASEFDWTLWRALWELRWHQLAEEGIILPFEEITTGPQDVDRDGYEWDYHHMDEVYLHGAGGFWLAWWENTPAGHIAGQDLGNFVELRHMYVRHEYRRQGIATCLVNTLLGYSKNHSAKAIELWTGAEGPGRFLYERMGFQVVKTPGLPYDNLVWQTNSAPGEDEIRMRYEF